MAFALGQSLLTAKRSTTANKGSYKVAKEILFGTSPVEEPCEDITDPEYLQLAQRICERIESRLPGRIQAFSVSVNKQAVVLHGNCQSYHTKQMAQHVAMGAINYEKLVNNISVRIL